MIKGLSWVAIVLGIGGGLLTGAPLGWLGRDLVFNTIEKPLLEQRERDACTIRTMDAASRAEAAEEARWKKISESALAAEDAQSAVRDAARVRAIDELNEEIEANEKRLAAEDLACPYDDVLADWLRKQWGLPLPARD